MNENKRVLINGLTKQEIEATVSCVGLINGESKQAEPVAWQFKGSDGTWYMGSDLNDHRKNTERAGFEIRDLYTHPAQPVQPAGAINDRLLSVARKIRSRLICEDGIENELIVELANTIAAAEAEKARGQG